MRRGRGSTLQPEGELAWRGVEVPVGQVTPFLFCGMKTEPRASHLMAKSSTSSRRGHVTLASLEGLSLGPHRPGCPRS